MSAPPLRALLRACRTQRPTFNAPRVCCVFRHCGGRARSDSSGKSCGESTGVSSPSSALSQDLVDIDESVAVRDYPPCVEQNPATHKATVTFLRTLITTTDEQEWKDMLVAAIRLKTWREHHVRSVLRSVHQSQYDADAAEGARERRGGRRRVKCTPSTRLQRALGVVQTAVEEGYRVAPESVHVLLVFLLRAAGADITSHAGTMGERETQSCLTDTASIWPFLSWMERNDYHVMSFAVLDSLEKIVEDSAERTSSGERIVGIRQNRLDYLHRERQLLSMGSRPPSPSAHGRGRGEQVMVMPDTGHVH